MALIPFMKKSKSDEPDFPKDPASMITRSKNDRNLDKEVWDLCAQFLQGNQWLRWRDKDEIWRTIVDKQDSQFERITVNNILVRYRNVRSRLSLAYPSIAVMPASTSPEDITKAKASELAISYLWKADDLEGKFDKAIGHLLTFGCAGLHTYYDEYLGRPTVEVFSPYDIFPEPDCSSFEDCDWCAIRTFHTKRDLLETYGVTPKLRKLIEANASAPMSPVSEGANYTDGERHPKNRIELYEFYWRDGRHGIALNDVWLYKGYEDKYDYPIEIIEYSNIPTKLWPLGLVMPMIDPQYQYNKTRSRIGANVAVHSSPVWMVPRGAGVAKTALSNRPNSVVMYNQGAGKPTRDAPPPVSSGAFTHAEMLVREIDDASGTYRTMMGQREPGIHSGTAIREMANQGVTQLQMTQASIERAAVRVAKRMLKLMAANIETSKVITAFDSSGLIVSQAIANTNLSETPEVFFQAGSMFRDNAAERERALLDQFDRGLITPQEYRQQSTFRSGPVFAVQRMESISHFRELLEAAKAGYIIEIPPWADLEAFRIVWEQFMKSPEYYSLEPAPWQYVAEVYTQVMQMLMGGAPGAAPPADGAPPSNMASVQNRAGAAGAMATSPQAEFTQAPAPPTIPGNKGVEAV